MAKAPPSFPLFYTNWIEGTDILSDLAYRCYMRLIVYQWVNGFLPESELARMNVCKIREKSQWDHVWQELKPKFAPVDIETIADWEPDGTPRKVWVSRTQHEIRQREVPKYQRVVSRNRKNGRRGGKPKSEPSRNPTGNPNETHSGKGERGKGKDLLKERRSSFRAPSVDEVRAYCEERENAVDAQAFVDHYEANGWVRGKARIRDWKACVRTWERSAREDGRRRLDGVDPFTGEAVTEATS